MPLLRPSVCPNCMAPLSISPATARHARLAWRGWLARLAGLVVTLALITVLAVLLLEHVNDLAQSGQLNRKARTNVGLLALLGLAGSLIPCWLGFRHAASCPQVARVVCGNCPWSGRVSFKYAFDLSASPGVLSESPLAGIPEPNDPALGPREEVHAKGLCPSPAPTTDETRPAIGAFPVPRPEDPGPDQDIAFPMKPADVLAKYRDRSSRTRKVLLALVGLVLLLAILTPVIALIQYAFVASDQGLGQALVHNRFTDGSGEELYCKDVDTEEGERLCSFFVQEGLFLPRLERGYGQGKTVQLAREDGVYVVSFVVAEEGWDRPEARELFRQLRGRISREVFEGQPVEVRLCERVLTRDWFRRTRLAARMTFPAEEGR